MKKCVLIFATLVLIALMMSCGISSIQEADIKSIQEIIGEIDEQSFTDGIVYDDLSDRFTITVYPTKIITENDKKNIVYRISVENKSEEAYKNFNVTIVMNEKLDQYIAAGVFPLPLANFDMAAKSVTSEDIGKGADVRFQQLLSDEQFMHEAGLKYEDILELGQSFELWLKWDGGEEKYKLTSSVIDETSP